MFANSKLSVNYILLLISILFLKSCLSFHIHIIPKNQNPNHNHNRNAIENQDNRINGEFKPLDKIANMLLSN